jgi:hypothetical protein
MVDLLQAKLDLDDLSTIAISTLVAQKQRLIDTLEDTTVKLVRCGSGIGIISNVVQQTDEYKKYKEACEMTGKSNDFLEKLISDGKTYKTAQNFINGLTAEYYKDFLLYMDQSEYSDEYRSDALIDLIRTTSIEDWLLTPVVDVTELSNSYFVLTNTTMEPNISEEISSSAMLGLIIDLEVMPQIAASTPPLDELFAAMYESLSSSVYELDGVSTIEEYFVYLKKQYESEPVSIDREAGLNRFLFHGYPDISMKNGNDGLWSRITLLGNLKKQMLAFYVGLTYQPPAIWSETL